MTAAYAYDPLGRRTTKSGTGVAPTYFLSSGDDEIAEYNSTTGSLLRRFVPGLSIDHPLAMVAGGTKTFFHQDKSGSVIAMSNVDGTLAEGPYNYDPFGNGASSTNEPFKYAGRRLDPETGLYYYRARYYSPAIGRFLQPDPVGYTSDLVLYSYVGNDPTNKCDPLGLDGDDCPGLNCNIPLPAKEDRAKLRNAVLNSRATPGGPEKGGQLYRDPAGKETIKTGSDAGVSTSKGPNGHGEFEHHIADANKPNLILSSHTHDTGGNGQSGLAAKAARAEQNAPSTGGGHGTKGTDLGAVYQTGHAVQTIGGDVTTTTYVDHGTPHVSIDAGDRDALPIVNLEREGIVVDPSEP
jgi:RHS repeat-associated protein